MTRKSRFVTLVRRSYDKHDVKRINNSPPCLLLLSIILSDFPALLYGLPHFLEALFSWVRGWQFNHFLRL